MINAVLQKWLLILAGIFAMVWAIVRASLQSITQDEGDTYFWFAAKTAGYIWYPFPNNHVLNTLLISISTRIFGLSSLTLRLPALLGAMLYILVCYFLCRSITTRLSLRLAVFVCLVYNPFIFDFMAAARGYSLANAFLLTAIAVPVWRRGRTSVKNSCILASLALGLSFAANYSFVFVDMAAFLAILIWSIRRRETESIIAIAASCIFPGLFVALLLCGYPLTHWPKGELFYGARSLGEMTQSMVQVCFYQLYPGFAHLKLYKVLSSAQPLLLPVLGILCVLQLVLTSLDGSWVQDVNARWLGKFAALLAGITGLCVLLHWIAFRFDLFPLPMTRTGIFLIPLCTLAAAAIGAGPAQSLVSQEVRRGITGLFICVACYFLLCLRLTYFQEYKDDADTKDIYSVLARINHEYGVTDTAMDGLYVAPLNFYRVLSKKETFPEFPYVSLQDFPAGKSIYVLHPEYFREFIKKERLAIVYRGKISGAVVAVRPDGAIPPAMIEP
jgi:hypothetical protein